MEKAIIALRGKTNVGKTETIKMVHDLILSKYPNALKKVKWLRTDITVFITINGVKIGIESQGDPGSRLFKSIDLFVKEQCDVIICATRTRGATVIAIESRSQTYNVVWYEKTGIDGTKGQQTSANLEMAESIFETTVNLINVLKPIKMEIVKSKGVTETEKLLIELCDNSFLKLWSYPNPVKDDKKELCDLLAVFDNQIFIFFDRESRKLEKYNENPEVSWMRWKKTVIDKQIRSVMGAERYIKDGREIFLDNNLNTPFPINIDISSVKIHKIIIAHGAKEACLGSSDRNVYGSLGVTYSKSEKKPLDRGFPFMINLGKENPVHVFDSQNLEIIFKEFDTFFDFQSYLNAKINAIEKYDFLSYCGEEDLLVNYFYNYNEKTNQHFIGTEDENIDGLFVAEGDWKEFINKEEYKLKKEADKSSYLWDHIIQKTSNYALQGEVIGNSNLFQGPSAIHEMAKEPRFMRRALADRIIKSIQSFPENDNEFVRSVSFMPSFYKDKGYVFLQLKIKDIIDYETEYRPKKRKILEIACGAAKNKLGDLKTIVGIAIDAPKFSKNNSEEFILLQCDNWSDKDRKYYEDANQSFNFFNSANIKYEIMKTQEFPEV